MNLLPLLAAAALAADKPVFKSAPGGTSLLELYSSEGCSSCPPADKFLSTLKVKPGLWKDFVPVAFHVDYWDYLGWKDVLGSPAHTARQRGYGRLFTPELVLNGRPWWPDEGDPGQPHADAGLLEVRPSGLLDCEVTFTPKKPGVWRAHAALLGFGIATDVRRGENGGSVLRHDFAALGSAEASLKDGKARLSIVSPNVKVKPEKYGLAVWVSPEGETRPVQAAGGWLAAPKKAAPRRSPE